jgi:hypothetical protein
LWERYENHSPLLVSRMLPLPRRCEFALDIRELRDVPRYRSSSPTLQLPIRAGPRYSFGLALLPANNVSQTISLEVLRALGLFQKFFRVESYPQNAVRMHSEQLDALFRLNSSMRVGRFPRPFPLRTQKEPVSFWKEKNHEGQQGRPHMHCREGSG